MKKSCSSGERLGLALKGVTLTASLLAALGSHATGNKSQGSTQHLPVSFNGEPTHPGDATSAAPLARADLQRVFKARCPGRVERLLGGALPTERPDFRVIEDICACAATLIDGLPQDKPIDQFQLQAAQAALACSKNTITVHNRERATTALGPYLYAQGLNAQQVSTFGQCVADTHWKNTVNAAGHASQADGSDWWATCTEQVGRKGLPQPRD